MEDSCEMWHTNAQCHKTKRQKDVVTSTSEMCVGSLEKAKIVPGAIKGQLVAFKNQGWQNNAWMQANLQAAGKAIHILQMVHSTAMAPQSKLADSR